MLVFIFKSWFKKVEWCWKREKKLHAYSGTNGSLFRLWLRLFACHAWCYFDSMLSSFCCSMTWLKWLRLLNVPFKESCVVFIIWEHIIAIFSFDALFRLIWRMLTTCLTLPSRHKPLWSFCFLLMIPLYALVNDVLSLCMIMTVIALLVGRSQSFASLHFVRRGNTSRASNSQKPKFSSVSTISTH
jgi:hypothetical protein